MKEHEMHGTDYAYLCQQLYDTGLVQSFIHASYNLYLLGGLSIYGSPSSVQTWWTNIYENAFNNNKFLGATLVDSKNKITGKKYCTGDYSYTDLHEDAKKFDVQRSDVRQFFDAITLR